MKPVRVAIAGVGNVASALLQGLALEGSKDRGGASVLGGRESAPPLEFVAAFDVNSEKIGLPLSEAIFVKPNCARRVATPASLGARVLRGPLLDGLDSSIREYIPFDEDEPSVEVARVLSETATDVLIILVPSGANQAATAYAEAAIEAGCGIVNGMPAEVANDVTLVERARRASVPLIGDDVKSQVGATAIHRGLVDVFQNRGAVLDRTLQLDWGGDMDFCNLTSHGRYEEGKRRSKTDALVRGISQREPVDARVSAVDYIPFLENQKEAYGRLEGRIFGNTPVKVHFFMSVEDGYDSAGVVVDMVRTAAWARERGLGGAIDEACALFCKRPPIQLDDSEARARLLARLRSADPGS